MGDTALPKITVSIPVGPNPIYKQWLPEAVESVVKQTYLPDEIFILDDQAVFTSADLLKIKEVVPDTIKLRLFQAPWLFGVATIFNLAVVMADNECVFTMGSDDKLMPECLQFCAEAYTGSSGWYNVTCQIDTGEIVDIPNHACMVTKSLWYETGGFPPSAGVGGPDALLLSIMMVHMPEKIIQVKQGTPLYWVRTHEHQMTRHDAGFFNPEVISIRNKETARFKRPEWTERFTTI